MANTPEKETQAPEPTSEPEAEKPAQMLVKLSAPLYHAFQVVALVDGTSVTDLVRGFVEDKVKARKPVLDAIEAAKGQAAK
jgi:hypothetical protein